MVGAYGELSQRSSSRGGAGQGAKLSGVQATRAGTSVATARLARSGLRGRDKRWRPRARTTSVDGNAVAQLGVVGTSSDDGRLRRFRSVGAVRVEF